MFSKILSNLQGKDKVKWQYTNSIWTIRMGELSQLLTDYLPKELLSYCCLLIASDQISLNITPQRKTKLGDYLLHSNGGHRISVNGDLDCYSFTITLIHELAHQRAFKIYGKGIKPHGKEWKSTFRSLMHYPLRTDAFPPKIKVALLQHMKSPKASSVRDIALRRAISIEIGVDKVFLEELNIGDEFEIKGSNKVFLLEEKIRTRYRCQNILDGKMYLVSRFAEVIVR